MVPHEFETLLLSRRETLIAGLEISEAELAGIQASRAESNADDEHDPEGSTLTSDWSRIAGLQSETAAQLEQIDRALDRIRNHTYGTCVTCGRRIPVGRLRVRPWADQCVECASATR